MSMSPQKRLLHTQEILFADGQRARAVFIAETDTINNLTLQNLLGIRKPGALIALAGGAAQMDQEYVQHLGTLFTEAIVPTAVKHNALLVDGGTHTGVMQLLGQGVARQKQKPVLLGVSPARRITYPGLIANGHDDTREELDPNHSHFILVETDRWGGETEAMYATIDLYAQYAPSVAILINGGAITKTEALYNVRQKRPLIIIEGSGRCADDILQQRQQKQTTITDPALAEIVQDGNIHPFPLSGSAEALVKLLDQILG